MKKKLCVITTFFGPNNFIGHRDTWNTTTLHWASSHWQTSSKVQYYTVALVLVLGHLIKRGHTSTIVVWYTGVPSTLLSLPQLMGHGMARLNGAFELSHCIRKAAQASAANLWRKEFRNCPRFYNGSVAMLQCSDLGLFVPTTTQISLLDTSILWTAGLGTPPHIFCSKCQLGTACQTQQQQNKWGRTGEDHKIVYNSNHCEFNHVWGPN